MRNRASRLAVILAINGSRMAKNRVLSTGSRRRGADIGKLA